MMQTFSSISIKQKFGILPQFVAQFSKTISPHSYRMLILALACCKYIENYNETPVKKM